MIRVALVLDDSFANGLVAMHEFQSLWIIGSAANRAREHEIRSHRRHSDVTWFEAVDRPESALFDLVESISDHDSTYTTGEPWNEIVVFGLKDPEAALRGVHEEYGHPVDIERCAIFNVDAASGARHADESS